MKRLAVISIMILSLFLSACYGGQSPTVPQQLPSTEVSSNSVTIQDFSFSPSDLMVKKGTTVTWANQDSAPHTVTSDSGLELNSETLSKGQSYSHTFSQAGAFEYHCDFHPMMKAKVIVE